MKYLAWAIVVLSGSLLVMLGEFSRFSPPPNAPSVIGILMILVGMAVLALLTIFESRGPRRPNL